MRKLVFHSTQENRNMDTRPQRACHQHCLGNTACSREGQGRRGQPFRVPPWWSGGGRGAISTNTRNSEIKVCPTHCCVTPKHCGRPQPTHTLNDVVAGRMGPAINTNKLHQLRNGRFCFMHQTYHMSLYCFSWSAL